MRTDEFEHMYARHAEPLLQFLRYRTGDLALAEDLLADTFERALTARRPFDRRRASEKTWLYTIALNVLRDSARRSAAGKRAVERVVAGQSSLPAADPNHAYEDAYDAVEQRDTLREALDHLSQEEREVIALRFGADLTVPEIAKVIRQRITTVEGRLYRALRKLRDELE